MKKDKVSFVRGKDFDDVDTALAEAMDKLDAANSRILELLGSEKAPVVDNAAPTPQDAEGGNVPPVPTKIV